MWEALFSAGAGILSASMQADAIKEATQMQIRALERQRDFVYDELDPNKLGGAMTKADIDRAQAKLALQSQIDPDLLAARYKASSMILGDLDKLGASDSDASRVSKVAANEAIAGIPGMQEAKQRLVDAALAELEMGATLPPDVQAELVKAGLETSGMTTGTANAKGFGGQLIRQILGSAGVALKKQRQDQAAGLLGQAQSLEQSRQQILGTLFPNLSTVQLNTVAAKQDILKQSNAMMAPAGPSGTDIANIWLARVGATNMLAEKAADIGSAGGFGEAQVWQRGFASVIPYAASAINSFTGAPKKVDPAIARYNPEGY